MLKKITLVVFFIFSFIASAQEGSLTASDRPGTGDGPAVVPPKEVQVEAGVTYQDAGFFKAYSFGEALIRIGLLERLEGRILLNSYNDVEVSNLFDASGLSDSGLGLKYGVVNKERFQLAILAGTTLPTGDDDFGSDDAHINLGFAVGTTFSDKLSWGLNGNWQDEENSDAEAYTFSTALAYALTDRTGLGLGYTQAFRDAPYADDKQFEATITFLVSDNLQFDGQFSQEVGSNRSDNYAIGAGIAYKF